MAVGMRNDYILMWGDVVHHNLPPSPIERGLRNYINSPSIKNIMPDKKTSKKHIQDLLDEMEDDDDSTEEEE